MKNQRSTNASIYSINQDVFADFDSPQTTDGSYKGTMKKVKATEAHLEAKFEERFREVNQRLKDAKTRVSITRKGNSLQLQATLPPKPDSDKVKPHQQLISLGVPANLAGLQTAWEDATELGKLLARKQFEWNEKYLNSKIEEVTIPTIGELLDGFEDKYFKSHKKTLGSELTIDTYKRVLKCHFPKEMPFIEPNVIDCLNGIKSPSIRVRALAGIRQLMKGYNLVFFDFSKIKKDNWERKERIIPTDKEIQDGYCLFEAKSVNSPCKDAARSCAWKLYAWCYGMLATYGLRPRELFVYPDIAWWLSPENLDSTWRVHKDCKTGAREAFPLHQNWVELFDLKNPIFLDMLNAKTSGDITSRKMTNLVSYVSLNFFKSNLGFEPYDLRHAWAIRAHMMGIPIKAAADNLGHSVDEHTKTYQKWFGRENRKNAINTAIAKKSEIDLLKDEVVQLKLENERLKIEVERYRLMSAEVEC